MSVQKVSAAGTSIWLDDLSRAKIASTEAHALPARIGNSGVVGVTTNPSIFSAAISGAAEYAADIAAMKSAPVDEVVKKLTTDDVRQACNLFTSIYEASQGVDGRVSIEVDPRLAHDTEGTIAAGKELWSIIDRPNVMIKVPATVEGLPAITALIAEGISVNVTLIFSVERYDEVINAYFAGLKRAKASGKDLSKIHSVASFFVSRVDTEVDKRLEALGKPELKSKAALANARLAYELFLNRFASAEWKELEAAGARLQRPLMASTGVKDPALPDTLYVTELVSKNLVNTMPEKTMEAVYDHGDVPAASITNKYDDARDVLAQVAAAGVSLDDATQLLDL